MIPCATSIIFALPALLVVSISLVLNILFLTFADVLLVGVHGLQFDWTEAKIDELRGTVTDLEQTIDQQADEIKKLRKERDDALDELREEFETALNGQYRAILKEEILDKLRDDKTQT